MKTLLISLVFALGATTGALALKFSDIQANKVARAIEAVRMADTLNAESPDNFIVRANMPNGGSPAPEIVLESDTQAYTQLLSAMRARLDTAAATAQTYLDTVGVTND